VLPRRSQQKIFADKIYGEIGHQAQHHTEYGSDTARRQQFLPFGETANTCPNTPFVYDTSS